jgi:hypothetical protein
MKPLEGPIMVINKFIRTTVGADLSRTPPIMHFQKLIPIMKPACTLLWLLVSSTFNFETALSESHEPYNNFFIHPIL